MNYTADLLSNNKLFGIEYIRSAGKSSMREPHCHEHYEMYYQLSGERYYFINNRSFYVKKGDLVLVKSDEIHKTISANENPYERILICFKKEYIEGMVGLVEDINLLKPFEDNVYIIWNTNKEQAVVENILNKMMEEHKSSEEGSKTLLRLLFLQFLIIVYRHNHSKEIIKHEYPSALHLRISKVSKYICENYSEPLSLASAAGYFNMSSCYLSRNFKLATGFTFVEYLNNVRIKEAKRLLKETNMNIISVALAVGFQNTTHFGRIFKAITNTTPLSYRKDNKC
jgi:AraC-like DNA-binding protein/mannose-6-phosphate isomerase-like protein (cupin superfamily)